MESLGFKFKKKKVEVDYRESYKYDSNQCQKN